MDNSRFNYSYHYENWHSDTNESEQSDVRLAKKLFLDHHIFPKYKDSKVLEIGCGMGRFMLMLRDEGYNNLLGVDIDKTQISVAKKSNLNVSLLDGIEYLKNSIDTFDVIYFFDFLEHLDKEKQLDFLKLVYEHLDDSGMIAFSVPNALAPSGMFYRYIDFTHTVSYCKYTISFLLHNAGFHYMDIRPQHKENSKVMRLKRPWADIYRKEFGIEDVILTPNLVTVAFKNKTEFESYLKAAPIIKNDYYKYNQNIFLRLWHRMKR